MTDIQIPESFKKLSKDARALNDGFLVTHRADGYDFYSRRRVNWVALPFTMLLVLAFGNVILNAPDLFDVEGMNVPGWAPLLFNGAIIGSVVVVLVIQYRLRQNNLPWLSVESSERQVVLRERGNRKVAFDHIKRVHQASEIVRFHGEGQPDRRYYELSLLILEREDSSLERIPLIVTRERSVSLKVADALKKALGLRKGSLEEIALQAPE